MNAANQESSYVETPSYHYLRKAIEDGPSPIFLVGERGMGKTAMLYRIAADWNDQDGVVGFIDFGSNREISGLLDELQRTLIPVGAAPSVLASSSDSAQESAIATILSATRTRRLLILLDEIERADDPVAVGRLALRFSDQGIKVVIAGEADVVSRMQTRLTIGRRFSRIDLQPWTHEEIASLLVHRGRPAEARLLEDVASISKGNPRLAQLVLDDLLERGESLGDLHSELVGDAPPTEILRQLLMREAEKLGPSPAELARPLVRLVLRGNAGLRRRELRNEEATWFPRMAIVTDDGDVVRLHDPTLGPELVLALHVLPPANTRLRDLTFGAEEAERDPLLAQHFIAPSGLDDLRQGRRNIVVGDRGAGKSALFATLTRERVIAPPSVQILTLEDPAELVMRLESEGKSISSAEQFRAAWLLSVASAIAREIKTDSPKQTKLAAAVRDALPGASDEETGGLVKRAWRWLRRGGLKIQLGPIVFDPPKARSSGGGAGQLIDLAEFFRETTAALKAQGRRVIVAIDRIDEVHKYQRKIQEPLVQGLFLAESSPVHGAEITLLVFIRTDLFETYDIQEKNKLVTRRLNLSWQAEDLLRMLVERVFANQSLAPLKEVAFDGEQLLIGDALGILFPAEIEGRPFEDWLWHSLKNGNGRIAPRQLILLLVLMRDLPQSTNYVLESLPLFNEALLRGAMTKLSELSFGEATDDFRVAPSFLRSLRAGKIEEFSLPDVQSLFAAGEGSVAEQVEMLERLGIVERLVVRGNEGQAHARMRLPALYTRCWQSASP